MIGVLDVESSRAAHFTEEHKRLLALDPADVAALTFELAPLCEATAAEAGKELADLSDPLLDVLAQRHSERERPLFVS